VQHVCITPLWLRLPSRSRNPRVLSLQAKLSKQVNTSHVKSWLHKHGAVVKADKLHPAVTRIIAEWFDLVDEDGSRTLEHHELLAALKVGVPQCSPKP
jgi:hypothetical protein